MNKKVGVFGMLGAATALKDKKRPYLVSFVFCVIHSLIFALAVYFAMKGLHLTWFQLLVSYASPGFVNSTNISLGDAALSTFLVIVGFIYFLILLPVIMMGNAWLGLESLKGKSHLAFGCFETMKFYSGVFCVVIVFVLFSSLIFLIQKMVALPFGSIGGIVLYSVCRLLIFPPLMFALLHVSEGRKVTQSLKFGFVAYARNFFTVIRAFTLIVILNLFSFVTIIGWIWIIPITSKLWGLLYQSVWGTVQDQK